MSTWREKYKVDPAADVFPDDVLDEDLAKLGEDIKANGLIHLSPSSASMVSAATSS